MKKRLQFLAAYTIFWMFIFMIARYAFIFYQTSLLGNLALKDWFLTQLYGMRMDLSMTGYFLLIISLFISLLFFLKEKPLKIVLSGFTLVFIIVCSIAIIPDFELYRNWGFRMDTTPLLYLKNPKEAAASANVWLMIVLFLVQIGAIYGAFRLFKKKVLVYLDSLDRMKWYWVPVWLIITGSMILPVRGSVGIAPMNAGMVYYSNNMFANHAALNVLWNVFYSLNSMDSISKTYEFYDKSKAEKEFASLYPEEKKREKVLNTERPNIVMVILESFTSKLLKDLGAKQDMAPNLSRIAKEGALFSNFYANGDRSDKGLVSILSSYPGHPKTSIMKYPSKSQSLVHLNQLLKKENYKSAYYYGGDLNFANMRSYIQSSGFEEIIDMDSFDASQRNSKWGTHDHVVFEKLQNDIENSESQFIKVFFTLSSHEPFEVPMETVIKGDNEESKFLNSIYYTDKCLGNFYDKLKKSPQWDNTLLVLVADHGSRHPNNTSYNKPEKFHIPMIWAGGALTVKDTTITKYASQLDILPTIMGQLGVPTRVKFGKDIFAKESKSFAYYIFNDGFGFLSDSALVMYSNVKDTSILSRGDSKEILTKGKAFLQVFAEDLKNR